MTDSNLPAMLTLAALAYRGFQDVLPGEPHEAIVRHALLDGLGTLAPVQGDWDLVWGPVTSRLPLGVFDSSAMYVVRHRRERRRYVVAVRGTNPVASSDWLFGDLWVAATVPWPYGNSGAAISMSTALGLASLQAMRWRPSSALGRFADAALSTAAVGDPFRKLALAGRTALSGTTETQTTRPSSLEAQLARVFTTWLDHGKSRAGFLEAIQGAAGILHLRPSDLRPRWQPAADSRHGIDLLSFLRTAADGSHDPLEITITGHSKGGALAPAVALWLQDALASVDPMESWDATRRARVSSYAFAGPTPGNAAFARSIDQRLGDRHHHLRNLHDLVTHAWQLDELRKIPALYGERTAPIGPLVEGIVEAVQVLDYRQATTGVTTFRGELGPSRPVVVELIHQHLDAYLDHLGLLGPEMNAVTFFI